MTEDVAANEPFAVKEIDLSANTILTANFLASYTNGGPLSGDFAEAWFTVPVFGDKVNVTIGAKATLDGNVSLFFGQPTDASLGGGGGALATTRRSGAFAIVERVRNLRHELGDGRRDDAIGDRGVERRHQ